MIDRKPQKIVDHKLGRFLADKLHKENGIVYDEVCLIAKGNVRAGYDLKEISSQDIQISNRVLFASSNKSKYSSTKGNSNISSYKLSYSFL